VDGDENIVLGVEGGLGWGEAEREEFVDFVDKSKVIAVELAERNEIQVTAVEAKVLEKE
jgi:hypothetical protein